MCVYVLPFKVLLCFYVNCDARKKLYRVRERERESQRVRAIRREAQSVFAAIKVLVTREVVGGLFL